jgi:hypothetical protein
MGLSSHDGEPGPLSLLYSVVRDENDFDTTTALNITKL